VGPIGCEADVLVGLKSVAKKTRFDRRPSKASEGVQYAVCGKYVGIGYKTSLNQPKAQDRSAMFSRL
jgi:hypothetical protein